MFLYKIVLRKKANLQPHDAVTLLYSGDVTGVKLFERHWETVKKTANVSEKREEVSEKTEPLSEGSLTLNLDVKKS